MATSLLAFRLSFSDLTLPDVGSGNDPESFRIPLILAEYNGYFEVHGESVKRIVGLFSRRIQNEWIMKGMEISRSDSYAV
jgi:hypothetical protein